MSSTFVIPAKKSDLLRTNDEFCVTNPLHMSRLSQGYRDLTRLFGENDISEYIQQFLNVYYYVTEHLPNMDWKCLNFYAEILKKVWSQLITKIDLHFNKKMFDAVTVLNEAKIVLYITNEFASQMDKKYNSNTGKKLNKKGKLENDVHYTKYCAFKEQMIFFILSVSSRNLSILFNPPLPELQFTELLSDCCYSSLKDHSFVKAESIRQNVFEILGNLIKYYNHSNTFVIKFVRLVKNTDIGQQNVLAQGILQIQSNFDMNSIVNILAKEIMILVEEEKSGESIDLKQLINFLYELALEKPAAVLPFVNNIRNLNNFDFPAVRLCYIAIIGELLRRVYSVEGLNQQEKINRNSLLDDLYDTIHDVSAALRSKVLQIFTKLLKDQALPISWLLKVMNRSVGRLNDRGILVRKNAIVLLKEFIRNRPAEIPLQSELLQKNLEEAMDKFNNLRLQPYSNRIKEIKDKCEATLMPFLKNAFVTAESIEVYDNMSFNEDDLDDFDDKILKAFEEESYDELLKYTIFVERRLNEDEARQSLDFKDLPEYYYYVIIKLVCKCKSEKDKEVVTISDDLKKQMSEQESIIEVLQLSIQYSKIMSSAVPLVEKMLFSKAVNDSSEAITFFASAVELGIDSAYDSLLQVLYILVTSRENKDQVYKMMTDICMTVESNDSRVEALNALKKLCFIVCKMKKSHRDAMCLLFKYWINQDMITPPFIQLCWETVTRKFEDSTDDDIHACLVILSLIAVNKPNVVWVNLHVVSDVLLESFAKADIQYAIHTLHMLNNMWSSNALLSKTKNKALSRLVNSDDIFTKVVNIVMHYFVIREATSFRQLANFAVGVIYIGSDQPTLMIESLIRKMMHAYLEGPLKPENKMKGWKLSRIIHTIGQVAANHIALLDIHVYTELTRRREIQDKTKNNDKEDIPLTPVSIISRKSASKSAKSNQTTNDDDDFIDCIGVEDAEANFVHDVLDKELLVKPSALSYALEFVQTVLTHRNDYDHKDLQIDAANALTSFMLVSVDVCQQNIQLLMTVLKHSKYPEVRMNTVVGFADLLVRFATTVEPWESYVFERLGDENYQVQKTALKFIAHLILTNMMRPKAYMSDIALFLDNKDEPLRSLAQHFFREMSTKDQNLYNALPDIISKMTDPVADVAEARFQKIMKSVLSYISKEKQMDGLVQKLCLRLHVATDKVQISKLAFCLSILNYSSKSIQVLINHFDNYKDQLNVPEIYKIFKDIAALGNKASAKAEMKAACTELDEKIEGLFDTNADKENFEVPKKKLTKKQRQKSNRRRSLDKTQNSEGSGVSDDSIALRRGRRTLQPKKSIIIDDSSTSDEEESQRVHKKRN